MFEVIGDDHEHLVSEVLASRRSVRRFSHIRPESWKIEKILDYKKEWNVDSGLYIIEDAILEEK